MSLIRKSLYIYQPEWTSPDFDFLERDKPNINHWVIPPETRLEVKPKEWKQDERKPNPILKRLPIS